MSTYIFIAVLLAGVMGSIAAKKLTVPAAITGGFLGCLLWLGVGWIGVVSMAVFFLIGTLATSWQKAEKQRKGLVKEGESKRTTGQVLANGGMAGILAVLAFIFPSSQQLFALLVAAVFSAAASDTVSSELGNVYGRRFYDIVSFRKGLRGENGVISLEGTLLGLLGSSVIAGVYMLYSGWNFHDFIILIISGTAGNLADSFLGATLERKQKIGNNLVNFLNTLTAVLTAILLLQF